MAKKRETIFIAADGCARAIYSPFTAEVLNKLGYTETRRASHVEPTEELSENAKNWIWHHYEGEIVGTAEDLQQTIYPPGKWWADLSPVRGPVLGPFETRDQALAAEVAWINEQGIPAPSDP